MRLFMSIPHVNSLFMSSGGPHPAGRTACLRTLLETAMARITVEDCQERVNNRFLLVQMAIKRVRQFREGYEPLVDCNNKEVVTALREIAAGKVIPEDKSFYTPMPEGSAAALDD